MSRIDFSNSKAAWRLLVATMEWKRVETCQSCICMLTGAEVNSGKYMRDLIRPAARLPTVRSPKCVNSFWPLTLSKALWG